MTPDPQNQSAAPKRKVAEDPFTSLSTGIALVKVTFLNSTPNFGTAFFVKTPPGHDKFIFATAAHVLVRPHATIDRIEVHPGFDSTNSLTYHYTGTAIPNPFYNNVEESEYDFGVIVVHGNPDPRMKPFDLGPGNLPARKWVTRTGYPVNPFGHLRPKGPFCHAPGSIRRLRRRRSRRRKRFPHLVN